MIEIELTEKKYLELFTEETKLNDEVTFYYDKELIGMYDHNFFDVSHVTLDNIDLIEQYALDNGYAHCKIVTTNESSLLIDNNFELQMCELTMYKENNDFGNHVRNDIEFRYSKDYDLVEDINKLDVESFCEDEESKNFTTNKNKHIIGKSLLKNNNLYYLCAYISNILVGFCSIVVGDSTVGLDDLVVKESYRKQYIATSILKEVSSKFNKPIYLHADENETPKDMYIKLGFKVIDKTYHYLKQYKTISTDRLVLRTLIHNDYHKVYSNWANDSEVTKYLTWNPHENESVSEQAVNQMLKSYKEKDTVRFVITINKETIGMIDIVRAEEKELCEIGYCMSRKYWGQGIMTEACTAFVKYLKELGYKRIQIHAMNDNIGSNKVIRKCGLTFVNQVTEIVKGKNVLVNIYEL